MADVKPDVKPENQVITVKLIHSNHAPVCLKAKRSTMISRVINSYAQQVSVNPGSLRALFNGQRLKPDKTMFESGIEDNDEIEMMIEQQGGSK
ncbi:MAG: ubiquitin-like protein [archaeon]|nr:ubiquitin-like protein [archaeon]